MNIIYKKSRYLRIDLNFRGPYWISSFLFDPVMYSSRSSSARTSDPPDYVGMLWTSFSIIVRDFHFLICISRANAFSLVLNSSVQTIFQSALLPVNPLWLELWRLNRSWNQQKLNPHSSDLGPSNTISKKWISCKKKADTFVSALIFVGLTGFEPVTPCL